MTTKSTNGKSAPPAPPPIKRRDASGHLDPAYAAGLLALSGHSDVGKDDKAFLKKARSADELAEQLGENYVGTITSGEEQGEEALDALSPEEAGGPFVVSTGKTEYAEGTDASNPADATREPFPTT